MDEATRLKVLLDEAAADIGTLHPPTVEDFRQRRRGRRLRAATAIMAAASVAAIAAATALIVTRHQHNLPARPPVSDASELAKGHWSELPPAPIGARLGASSAWTGSQFLVWGGSEAPSDKRLSNSGAAYDPASRSWSMLPPSPLAPREYAASVWTGKYWFVWGGYLAGPGAPVASDGALYDPALRTWRLVPSAPISDGSYPSAAWTGSEVVVVTARRAPNVHAMHAAAFDPGANRWEALPDITAGTDQPLAFYVLLAMGNRLGVWFEWDREVPLGGNSYTYKQGVVGYVLEPGSTKWVSDTRLAPDIPVATGAVWTGARVYIPAGRNCWACAGPGPFALPLTGVLVDPSTGAKTSIAKGPVASEQLSTNIWTGNALLAFNFAPSVQGNDNVGAAAWDAKADSWFSLPNAPYGFTTDGFSAAWTGSQLLVWGQTEARNPKTVGLMFGR